MVNSLYRFSEVEAKTAKPLAIRTIIENLLRADDDACYVEMERYLRGNANTGSVQFDHSHAVRILLETDKLHNGQLHIAIKEKDLSEKEVWNLLNSVLIKAGFKFQNGKMIGLLLEDNSTNEAQEEIAA